MKQFSRGLDRHHTLIIVGLGSAYGEAFDWP